MIDKIKELIGKWVITKGLKKGAIVVAQAIVSFAIANKISFVGEIYGVKIDLSNVEVMTACVLYLLEVLRNFLKTRFPKQFGWL